MSGILAQTLMDEFAQRTGLSGEQPPRRYLWTDAFAVCNFLGLRRTLGEDRYLHLAEKLVDQVHHVLGRHRADDSRCGWISGLDEEQGERSPTRGGLRIGKSDPEPAAEVPEDDRSQWDADGQYFHYLTKWMHALRRVAAETQQSHYLRWAIELGVVSHRAFTYETSSGAKRMVWKMSIDLARPLVSSMGHHDPLDGLITLLELQQAASPASPDAEALEPAIQDLLQMCRGARWATTDALGIGGLLMDASVLGHLVFDRGLVSTQGTDLLNLLQTMLYEAELSLQSFALSSPLSQPHRYRLPFRELGLCIGLRLVERLNASLPPDRRAAAFGASLLEHRPMAEWIEAYWSDPDHRCDSNWLNHEDINSVMLATSLEPTGFEPVSPAAPTS